MLSSSLFEPTIVLTEKISGCKVQYQDTNKQQKVILAHCDQQLTTCFLFPIVQNVFVTWNEWIRLHFRIYSLRHVLYLVLNHWFYPCTSTLINSVSKWVPACGRVMMLINIDIGHSERRTYGCGNVLKHAQRQAGTKTPASINRCQRIIPIWEKKHEKNIYEVS